MMSSIPLTHLLQWSGTKGDELNLMFRRSNVVQPPFVAWSYGRGLEYSFTLKGAN